jgi:hypothetical protein
MCGAAVASALTEDSSMANSARTKRGVTMTGSAAAQKVRSDMSRHSNASQNLPVCSENLPLPTQDLVIIASVIAVGEHTHSANVLRLGAVT